MFERFTHCLKVFAVKAHYVVCHPQVLFSEYSEEVRTRVWAREVAKKA